MAIIIQREKPQHLPPIQSVLVSCAVIHEDAVEFRFDGHHRSNEALLSVMNSGRTMRIRISEDDMESLWLAIGDRLGKVPA